MPASRSLLVATLVLTAGCAVDPQHEFEEVQEAVRERTGHSVAWIRTPEDQARVDEQKRELLAGGLTRAEAVQIALLDNRGLQAVMEDVGVTKANLVQSYLLSNPNVSAALRFPVDGGKDIIESGLLGFLSDIWVVPLRYSMQEHMTAAVLRRVEATVVDVAVETTRAYDHVLLAQAKLELSGDAARLQEDTLARTKVRFGSGMASDLEVHQSDAQAAQRAVEKAQAKRNLTQARAKLAAFLNLDPPQEAELELLDTLDGAELPDWTTADAVAYAAEHRLDLAGLAQSIERADWAVTLAKVRIFGDVKLGVSHEGVIDEEHEVGPSLSLELPIFDQNQAQIAKAEYHLRQRRKLLDAAKVELRLEVQTLLAELSYRATQIRVWREREEPALAGATEFATRFGNMMRLEFLHALRAREQLLQRRHEYLDALWRLRVTLAELDRVLRGGGSPHVGGMD